MSDQWETVTVFQPPSPLVAQHWTRKEKGKGYTAPVPSGPLDVYVMQVQRTRDGKSRIVSSVMDRHGVITPVEPGYSDTHITFITTRGVALSEEDKTVLKKWWDKKPVDPETLV